MNFWQFVTSTNTPPLPSEIGRTLHQCHLLLRSFAGPLPKLAILTESLSILKTRDLFPKGTLDDLVRHLTQAIDILHTAPHQPLHGDAHMGNLMQTTDGLLWTDWEDTFSGPIEWDLASIIWNAQILDEDHDTVDQILSAYTQTGGQINRDYLHQSLIARAVVMISWYPILYPNPNADRQAKLQRRLDWLKTQEPGVH
jgi:thiamine kinase-like enzyme